ncbi:phosphoglucomutase (alpha-D-glucose-1,6-bisphosphate-dependent) [Methylacidimicrobium sp. B4]|uniref:phosphoglucomutase (alpha-D-glucose-1,6-bisphosphate-dependent) n=1 Tax=Methylacidimicrobium sp. B4 TaxID=2796139 RepID=UPI001A8DD9F9|nr:phosphoglucomutase (alpha-D-glucose-1,6-bisphosphate-dependent) [Methylacidimicrobium sp. B4]QSR84918.1 alpha-D-glucose phosphate-specific phosphoglucomutase [Methylacidimicrobium sp. B4]
MEVSPLAGKLPPLSLLADLAKLTSAYYELSPDPKDGDQRVKFGTSGHRGSSLRGSFNQGHILAISQAICDYRRDQGISGPLFLGKDTHALSEPAFATALEVLAANGVEVRIDPELGYTPTPVISHAILTHNRDSGAGQADGIVITPSHNPPTDGGFKYNPPHGGPADTALTRLLEERANALLPGDGSEVRRMPYERALCSAQVQRHDYLESYSRDLISVVDCDLLRSSSIRIGIDPLGGAGVHYWKPIADRYGWNLTLLNETVDATFRFLTVDWDGQIRMDCSSPYAMAGLIGRARQFDIAFGCDTDHDRHGIVAPSCGLLNPNHFLAVAASYLFGGARPGWSPEAALGKTVVSSAILDRVAEDAKRPLFEVPVGFKWFVEGLLSRTLGFAGEESAGATLLRKDGRTWTTDKDGMVLGLLAAEITARTGKDPGVLYQELTGRLGNPFYERIDAPASHEQKKKLLALSPEEIAMPTLAGDPVTAILNRAPSGGDIGGIKVITSSGWFAARPSGTEEVYKLYAESFRNVLHLRQIQQEARATLAKLFAR